MNIDIDQDKCVASGQCVMTAPEVFDQRDEDGVAFLLVDASDASSAEDVRQAAALCPAVAITLREQ
ncbi:ferredoxin [Actinoplanes sp. NPDC051470]|uniref:ferredoxin n=1 Tax=unclassified Actinoplanes TaxID=2626549 RepID=UPI00343D8FA5